MKRLLFILSTLFLVIACEAKPQNEPKENVPLEVSKAEFEFDAAGGEDSFMIKATEKPSIVGRYDWCILKSSAFESNSMTVSMTVSENKTSEERNAEFSIVCGSEKKYVKVHQAGKQAVPEEPASFLDEPALPENQAVAFVKKLGFGWNLGNQMDAQNNGVSGETFWGNAKCTQATMDGLKAKGFSTVRIPVTWMGHIGAAPDYKVEDAWLDRVAEIAGYAKKAGLNAIVNIHHDDSPSAGWLCVHKAAADAGYKTEMFAKYTAMWKQIATKFADEGDWLIFEGYNELQDGNWGWGGNLTDGGKQYSIINELAQTFVTTVRSVGGANADRYLSVLGYSANPSLTMENLVLPTDTATDRLVVSVHFYDPGSYALGQNAAYTEWGHTGAAGKKDPNHGEKNVIDTFKALKEKYIDNNIPVYIGECGAVNRSDERAKSFQRYWFEFIFKAARAYGLSPVIWDNGAKGTGHESFGFINHSDGSYINDSKPVLDVAKKAYTSTDSAYTLKSVYENAPQK